jgi:hypothetical protein
MFKNIVYWSRVDSTGLGRPKLEGCEPVQTLAVPMCILGLIHELEDAGVQTDEMSETRKWAVDAIKYKFNFVKRLG